MKWELFLSILARLVYNPNVIRHPVQNPVGLPGADVLLDDRDPDLALSKRLITGLDLLLNLMSPRRLDLSTRIYRPVYSSQSNQNPTLAALEVWIESVHLPQVRVLSVTCSHDFINVPLVSILSIDIYLGRPETPSSTTCLHILQRHCRIRI